MLSPRIEPLPDGAFRYKDHVIKPLAADDPRRVDGKRYVCRIGGVDMVLRSPKAARQAINYGIKMNGNGNAQLVKGGDQVDKD